MIAVDLKGLFKWLKEEKKIVKVDMMELSDYVPEYEKWLKEKKR